jgi:hypothetical protein
MSQYEKIVIQSKLGLVIGSWWMERERSIGPQCADVQRKLRKFAGVLDVVAVSSSVTNALHEFELDEIERTLSSPPDGSQTLLDIATRDTLIGFVLRGLGDADDDQPLDPRFPFGREVDPEIVVRDIVLGWCRDNPKRLADACREAATRLSSRGKPGRPVHDWYDDFVRALLKSPRSTASIRR